MIIFSYFLTVTFLLSFKEGVNSPPSTEKSLSNKNHFLTVYALEMAFSLAASMLSNMYFSTMGHFLASSTVRALDAIYFNKLVTSWVNFDFSSYLRVKRTIKYFYWSPITIAFDIILH